MLSTIDSSTKSPDIPPALVKRRATLKLGKRFNQLFHEDSLTASTASPQRRFSLGIFSKDRKNLKNVAPRPLSVATSKPTNNDIRPNKASPFIIDDSVLSESFDHLNFDCNSFMADLHKADLITPAHNLAVNQLSNNSNDLVKNSHVTKFGLETSNCSINQPIADFNCSRQSTPETESHSRPLSRRQSFSNSFVHRRRPSIKRLRSTSTHFSRKVNDDRIDDFKALETEYNSFTSKAGIKKANVLRLALLPFLRQQRSSVFNGNDVMSRAQIFQKWWIGILNALRDYEKPVSGSDRAAYLEGIAGLVCRPEWFVKDLSPQVTSIFENMLFDTLRFVVGKLSLKTVPISVSVFAGKILAYAFFYAPGVAPVLLYLLRVPTTNVRRIVKLSFTKPDLRHVSLADAINLVKHSFPDHLNNLIGSEKVFKMNTRVPPCPSEVPDLLGPWIRRWTNVNSDVFFSFFKHYYTIISQLLPAELPWNAHLASPGLLIIHAFILGIFDIVVHPKTSIK